ncbi:Arabinanase/levansucrase/invertase [Glarea lozoyensis ATCC 20868]|uniref:Arabinanase/levansucrase/invertase n=1 Tax=Glarea lozoyensis (strain ATCC 20868 / MF5171) TaxID=1116229 RepID=S3DU34_GLAL2|nr:Arabinanase/levansucrase/invertase [Glarea lozoyensis ATCC 20868]EPE35461.1 Arabinanase/levansucrase/invertase [Glarea lozoyensis ATCC 20868]
MSFQRPSAVLLFVVVAILLCLVDPVIATKIRNGADPTVMKIGNTYYSAESSGGGIDVRAASSLEGLGAANVQRQRVWTDNNNRGDVWAPEITTDLGRTFIHFSAGKDAAHRMYVISADSPLGSYSTESKLALPDDQWAIDGTFFVFEGRGLVCLVWLGEREPQYRTESLYLSYGQPDQAHRLTGPEAIVDPDGQLHIVYSANGSWASRYCLGDLRLRKGGDPGYVWDWYKSNGCLFGSHQDRMMKGWDATLSIDGPGHHTFALPNGAVNQSPGGTNHIPFVFHGVPKGTPYSWENRAWFTGSFVWWSKTAYTRQNSPGDASNTGFSFKFFE